MIDVQTAWRDTLDDEPKWQLVNLFWTCDNPGLFCEDNPGRGRVRRLADINTDTQIGGGRYTENDPTYTLINIHGPTAIWACIIFGLLLAAALALRIWYVRRHNKMKGRINRHRAIAISSAYHRADCSISDHERECNCKTHGRAPRPAHFDDDAEAHCGQALWVGP